MLCCHIITFTFLCTIDPTEAGRHAVERVYPNPWHWFCKRMWLTVKNPQLSKRKSVLSFHFPFFSVCSHNEVSPVVAFWLVGMKVQSHDLEFHWECKTGVDNGDQEDLEPTHTFALDWIGYCICYLFLVLDNLEYLTTLLYLVSNNLFVHQQMQCLLFTDYAVGLSGDTRTNFRMK